MEVVMVCVCVCEKIYILLYRDSDETDVDTIKWTLGPVIIRIDKQPPPRQLPPFSYPEDPSPRTKDAKTPMQARILQLFLTTAILDSIVPVSYTHLTLPTNREV